MPRWPAAVRESLEMYFKKLMQNIRQIQNKQLPLRPILDIYYTLALGALGVENPTEGPSAEISDC